MRRFKSRQGTLRQNKSRRASKRLRRSRQAQVEQLEIRTLMSVTGLGRTNLLGNTADIAVCGCDQPGSAKPSGSSTAGGGGGGGGGAFGESGPTFANASSSSAVPYVYATPDGNAVIDISLGGIEFSYNSGTAAPKPMVMFDAPVTPFPLSIDSDMEVQIKSYLGDRTNYVTSDTKEFEAPHTTAGGETSKTFVLQMDNVGSLTTGRYLWSVVFEYYHDNPQNYVEVSEGVYETQNGATSPPYKVYLMVQDVINRHDSQFGAGWWLPELDRLVITQPPANPNSHTQPLDVVHGDWGIGRVSDGQEQEHFDAGNIFGYRYDAGALLVTGDNRTKWFRQLQDGSGNYGNSFAGEDANDPYGAANPTSLGTLSKLASGYQLLEPDGTKEIFNSSGLLIDRVDRRGQITRQYAYTGDHLDTITEYPSTYSETGTGTAILTGPSSRVYHFEGGLSVTDHYGTAGNRTFYFGGWFTGSPITSVQASAGSAYTIHYNALSQVSELIQRGGMDVVYNRMAQQVVDATGEHELFSHVLNHSSNNLDDGIVEKHYEGNTLVTHPYSLRRDNNEFDASGNPDAVYHFDWLGTSVTRPSTDPALTNTTYFHYDVGTGLLHDSVAPDPSGINGSYAQNTLYSYDREGYVAGVTPPGLSYQGWTFDSQITTASGDTAIVPSSYTDGTDTVNYHYNSDGSGDPDYTSDAVGNRTYYKYTAGGDGTPAGLVQDMIDAQGRDTHYAYSGLDLTAVTTLFGTPDTQTTQYVFTDDGRRNIKEIIDPALRHTRFVYNYSDLVTERDDPDPATGAYSAAQAWHFTYDANGHVTSVTDPLGNTTGYIFDGADKLYELVEPNPAGSGPGLVTRYDRDEHGMVETMTDPMNNVTTFTYDVLHELISQADPAPADGQYHPTANPPTNPTTQYFYNLDGWLTKTVDPIGNIKAYLYDPAGRQTRTLQLTDGGVSAQYFAGTSTQPTMSRVDSNITSNDLSSSGLSGNYHVHWRGAIYIDTSGATTFNLSNTDLATLSIDGAEVINAGSHGGTSQSSSGVVNVWQGWHLLDVDYTHFGSDAASISLTYQLPGATSAASIPANKLSQAVVNRTQYDGNSSRVSALTDAMGHATSFQYNVFDEITSTTLPDPGDGHGSPMYSSSYDRVGNQISQTDPLGQTNAVAHSTHFVYDERDRLIQTIQPIPDGHALEQHSQTTDGLSGWNNGVAGGTGASHTFHFSGLTDGKNYEVQIEWVPDSTNPDAYDKDARFQIYTTSATNSLRTVYLNLNGQPDAGNTKVLGAFQASGGNLYLSVSDHDNSGHLALAIVKLVEVGPLTTYTYDPAGNLKTLTDADGNSTTWDYDALNRVKTETNALGKSRQYHYDADSNLIQYVDRDGRTTRYDYDHLNRQVAERWRDYYDSTDVGGYAYTYDADSRLLTSGDTLSFNYDHLGRAVSIGQGVVTLAQTFYDNGNRKTVSVNASDASFTNTYGYDALDRMTSVSQTGVTGSGSIGLDAKYVKFNYNADGQFASIERYAATTPSSSVFVAKSVYGYDNAGRLTSLAYTDGYGTTTPTTTYAGYSLEYDAANRITRFTNSVNSDDERRYKYDNIGRLTDVGYAGQAATHDDEAYQYDANGNRESATVGGVTSSYALRNVGTSNRGNNQIVDDGQFTYQYDDEGNLISKTSKSDENDYWNYSYDNRNRLTEVFHHGISDGGTRWFVTTDYYEYDAFDHLIHEYRPHHQEGDWDGEARYYDTDYSYDEHFVYDGNQVVLRYYSGTSWDGEQSFISEVHIADRYLWGPVVDMLLADDQQLVETPGGDPDSSSGQGILWAVTDQQNTPRGYLTGSGSSVSLQANGLLSSFGDQLSSLVSGTIITFAGGMVDPDTGLVLFGKRWENTALGTWMTQDPVGFASGTTNLYAYCGGDPVNNVDPEGLEGVPVLNPDGSVRSLGPSQPPGLPLVLAAPSLLDDPLVRAAQERENERSLAMAPAPPPYQEASVAGAFGKGLFFGFATGGKVVSYAVRPIMGEWRQLDKNYDNAKRNLLPRDDDTASASEGLFDIGFLVLGATSECPTEAGAPETFPVRAPRTAQPRPGSVSGNPANRLMETGTPLKDGSGWVRRWTRATAAEEESQNQAIFEHYQQVEAESRGLPLEQQHDYRFEQMRQFRIRYRQNLLENRGD